MKKKQRSDRMARERPGLQSVENVPGGGEVGWMSAPLSLSGEKSKVHEQTSLQISQFENPHLNGAPECGDEEIIFTDNPSENCMFICGICRVAVKSIRLHVSKYHQLTTSQYRALYPELEYHRKTYHR